MDILQYLGDGFEIALQPTNLLIAFSGVFIGTLVGLLPGIGPINGIALLIPLTFALGLPPESAIILFAGIYYGSQYGNSISSILLNVPGSPAGVVTTFDGYPMAQAGRAGPALAMSAVASFVGGTLSLIGLMLFAPLLSGWALKFGPAEYFALMILAFSTLSSLTGDNLVKGGIATVFGLMLATVGLDPNSAVSRFTFGALNLLDGLDFVVVTIGLFAISELLFMLEKEGKGSSESSIVGRVFLKGRDLIFSGWTMLRSSLIGFFIGVLPGAGGTISRFVAYTTEKQWLNKDDTFGKGDIRGVAAPESANNAAANGAMIPLLTLGIPGSATTAVMLGALLSMNVTPGPLLISMNPTLFWGLIASMYIGNIMLLVLNLPLVGFFVRIQRVPVWFLAPAIAMISFVAVYAVNNSSFDLLLMTGFGLVGYVLRKHDFPLAPIVLGLVLGPLMEKNLRRALSISDGDWSILFSSPIAIGVWILALVMLFAPKFLKTDRRDTDNTRSQGGT